MKISIRMRKLKIGDTVTARLFGGKIVTGTVENIEITTAYSKSGRVVKNCDLDKHHNGVVDLSCDHWCYFYQI